MLPVWAAWAGAYQKQRFELHIWVILSDCLVEPGGAYPQGRCCKGVTVKSGMRACNTQQIRVSGDMGGVSSPPAVKV